jgi:hypothetical protein
MKIELESQDVQCIAEKVLEIIKPYLAKEMPREQDIIFDKKGLADYLNIDTSWIDKNYEEKLPHFHIGKYVRFRKSLIDKLADAHNVRVLSSAKALRKGMAS